MYDYTTVDSFEIENVDHEIHILGATPSSMVYALGVFGLTLPIFGPLAIAIMMLYLVFSRQFFLARERGEPIEYDEQWIGYLKVIPFVEDMFGLDKLIYSERWYRG